LIESDYGSSKHWSAGVHAMNARRSFFLFFGQANLRASRRRRDIICKESLGTIRDLCEDVADYGDLLVD
jgi:hypothetical protein